MDIQAKHTDVILRSKMSIVDKVNTLYKKLDYGDTDFCCINKLYLAMLLINRLECYCFTPVLPDTECHNCIEDSDLSKMYELLSELLE